MPPRFAAYRKRLAHAAVAVLGIAVAASGPPDTSAAEAGAGRSARLRVGVALSGGGARGLAHIGVLQWFEEHRIPVDCVAGTSMGGLIGGLTAAGLTPDSLRAFVLGANWEKLFAASVSYDRLAWRRKEDAQACPVRFEVGLRWGPQLPSGLNPGQGVQLLLSAAVLAQSGKASFDDLPVPFRCVATDLATGTAVVLDRGSLVLALRATMAIAGVFEPVWLDGHFLVDGGLVERVPVDAVRALGPDVVIAVDVNAVTVDPVPDDILGILERALEIPGQVNAESRLARADIVIHVDSRDARTTDYARSIAVIDAGYRAAAAQASRLLPLALDSTAWAEHLQRRRPQPSAQPEVPNFVAVDGVPRPEAEWIARGLQRHAGHALDPAALERDLDRLVGTGRYASTAYEWMHSDAGLGLRIRVREKPYGPPAMRFGLDANNKYDELTLTAGARVTFIDLVSRGSEARIDLALGAAARGGIEFFQPLGPGGQGIRSRFFAAPRAFARRDRQDFYAGAERAAATWRVRAGAGADAGWIGGTRLEFRAGYETSRVDEDVWIGTLPAPHAEGREQFARVRLAYEGQDTATLPRDGVFLESEARWYLQAPGAAGDFGQASVEASIAVPSRAHDRTLLALESTLSYGEHRPPAAEQPTLGGFLRLGAFQNDELRNRRVFLARVTHFAALWRLGGLSGDRVYALGSAELGSAFETAEQARGQVSGTLGLAADTVIGSCAFAASVGSEGRWRFHFTAGRPIR